MKKLFRLTLAVTLSAVLIVTPVLASPSSSELKKEKEAAQQKASELEEQKSSAESEVTALESELSEMILKISQLEEDITNKEAEVQELTQAYNDAQEDERAQYEDMKLRIQYMYEEGDGSFVEKIFSSDSISDLLNQVDYVQSVHKYDREKLQEYVETTETVAELKTSVEEEVQTLEKSQKKCTKAKGELEETITEKQAEVEDFDQQLENAKKIAAQKAAEQKQAEIAEAEEAAQKAADEAAAKASSSSSKKNQSNSSSNSNSSSSSSNNGSGSSNSGNSSGSSSSGSSSSGSSSSSSSSSSNSGSSSSSNSSNSSSSSSSESTASSANASTGQAIANYACQFIGNPYVWGGTSLTNGTDCSGFTMSVMAHFGYSIPHSSYSQRSVGKKVSSLSEALPGDIICFNGHVAIYCGGGMIVHASNPKYGIVKTTIGWTGKSVVAIRRVW